MRNFLRLSVHQQAFLSVVSLVGEWTSRYYISGYKYLLGGIYYTIKNLSGRIACIFFLKLKIFEKFYLGKHGYTINVYLEFTGVHIDCSFFSGHLSHSVDLLLSFLSLVGCKLLVIFNFFSKTTEPILSKFGIYK